MRKKAPSPMMKMNDVVAVGSLHKYNFAQADNVWSINGICPTILAYNQGQIGHQINILEEEDDKGGTET